MVVQQHHHGRLAAHVHRPPHGAPATLGARCRRSATSHACPRSGGRSGPPGRAGQREAASGGRSRSDSSRDRLAAAIARRDGAAWLVEGLLAAGRLEAGVPGDHRLCHRDAARPSGGRTTRASWRARGRWGTGSSRSRVPTAGSWRGSSPSVRSAPSCSTQGWCCTGGLTSTSSPRTSGT